MAFPEPKKPTYKLIYLAEKWGYSISDLFYLAEEGELQIYKLQNEPDIQVSYESCDWTSTQMINFLKDYGSLIEGSKIAAPESYNFSQTYTNAILNDANAANNVDIVAGHIYGGGLDPFPVAEQKGKAKQKVKLKGTMKKSFKAISSATWMSS